MSKILKRDEFITEVYTPQMEYDELRMVNEGLLKTLFGAAKNLFKKDWSTIKGNSGIIKAYKEMDDRLTGFSLMKLSKKDTCNQIRQVLVDFACDWYDKKMNDAKKDEVDPRPAKSMKFKDDTLRENLENTQKKIRDLADGDEQMTKWAELLMNDMKNVINRTILSDIKDEETKKEVEDMINDTIKKNEDVNKKMEEWQNGQLKEIRQEREKLISDMGAALVRSDIGDKAIGELNDEFKRTRKSDGNVNSARIKKDSLLGLKEIYADADLSDKKFKTAYKLMDSFYRAVSAPKIMDKFKETPGKSVQAMCIGLNAFIKHCVYGDTDYAKTLPIMTKCAIISNGTISYNLPLNDAAVKDIKSKEAGNYFTDIAEIVISGKMTDEEGKKIKLPDDVADNAKAIFKKIREEAEKMKTEAEKNYDEKLKSLNLEEEK